VIRGIGDTHGWVVDHAMTTSRSMANYADNWETACTTGNQDFTVCQRHMAKLRKHMAKSSPTVAAGKPQTAATGMAKDEFAVCHFSRTHTIDKQSITRSQAIVPHNRQWTTNTHDNRVYVGRSTNWTTIRQQSRVNYYNNNEKEISLEWITYLISRSCLICACAQQTNHAWHIIFFLL